MYRSIRPGKTWYDTNGNKIQAHGGSVLYAEGKFWWYGENKAGITGRATGEQCPFWHHGVKLYSSTDLYNWTDEGFAVKESEDKNNPFHPTRLMDRPHILYNKKTKKYVLWAKTSGTDFLQSGFSVCVGDTLKEMTFVKEIIPTPQHAGDFDLFIKEGKGYVIFENPHHETVCRELTEDFLGVTDVCSVHQKAECPPFVREAPARFQANGREYLLTSGTTGYFPNRTQVDEITNLHGEWQSLGDPCVHDEKGNSFHAQFASVFKHPHIEGLYIALGDRWLTDLPCDLPDVEDLFYRMCSGRTDVEPVRIEEILSLSDENTSEGAYVWLPITFEEGGKPTIHWRREWKVEDFQK